MAQLTCPSCGTKFRVQPAAFSGSARSVKCKKCVHVWKANKSDLIMEATDAPMPMPAPRPIPAPAPAPEPAPIQKPPPRAIPKAPTKPPLSPEPKKMNKPSPKPGLDQPSSLMKNWNVDTTIKADDMRDLETNKVRDKIKRNNKKPPAKKPSTSIGYILLLIVLLASTSWGAYWYRIQVVQLFPETNVIFTMLGAPVDLLSYGLVIGTPVPEAILQDDKRILKVSGEVYNTISKPITVPVLHGMLLDTDGAIIYEWLFRTVSSEIMPGEFTTFETLIEEQPAGAVGLQVTFITEEEASAAGLDYPSQ